MMPELEVPLRPSDAVCPDHGDTLVPDAEADEADPWGDHLMCSRPGCEYRECA